MTRQRHARVLLVVLQLDPGGTERMVIELARRIRTRCNVMVCCLDAPGAWAGELVGAGVQVQSLGRRPGFHPSLGFRLAGVAREFGATVLHCHHYSPFVYGRMAVALLPRTGLIFTEHGRLSDAPPSSRRRRVNRWLCLGVRKLFAVSHALRDHMLREGFPPRTGVIWNGIEIGPVPTERHRIQARASLGLASDDYVIGTVARLDPVKSLETMVEAVSRVRQRVNRCKLVIIGDGPEKALLTALIQRLRMADMVMCLGHRSDARALLPAFDVYMNSSVSEGVSLTLLEAMAARLPVIATRVGGTPEVVVHKETGLLCEARSPEGLSEAVLELVQASALPLDLAHRGRRRVESHFDIDQMVAKYAELYESAA